MDNKHTLKKRFMVYLVGCMGGGEFLFYFSQCLPTFQPVFSAVWQAVIWISWTFVYKPISDTASCPLTFKQAKSEKAVQMAEVEIFVYFYFFCFIYCILKYWKLKVELLVLGIRDCGSHSKLTSHGSQGQNDYNIPLKGNLQSFFLTFLIQ